MTCIVTDVMSGYTTYPNKACAVYVRPSVCMYVCLSGRPDTHTHTHTHTHTRSPAYEVFNEIIQKWHILKIRIFKINVQYILFYVGEATGVYEYTCTLYSLYQYDQICVFHTFYSRIVLQCI